jgi:lysozyme family protein
MNAILDHTFAQEGGILVRTNRRGDAGGETVGGVSRVKRPNLAWWWSVDIAVSELDITGGGPFDLSPHLVAYDELSPVLEVIREGVIAEYHKDAWLYKPADPSRRVHVTDIDSQAVATKLFSIKINGGTGMLKPCVRALQKKMTIGADGIFGPGTLAYVNQSFDAAGQNFERNIVAVLAQRQVEYYCRIVQKKVKAALTDQAYLASEYVDWLDGAGDEEIDAWVKKVVAEAYDATDAGNLVGWCANRAFGGLV